MTTMASETSTEWISVEPTEAELNPHAHRRRQRRIERSAAIAVPLAALALWQLAGEVGWLDDNFFPAPTKIAASWWDMIQNGVFWDSLVASTRRIVLGYLIGTTSAVILGLIIGSTKTLRAALEPTIAALYTVPKLAILPLLLLIFGLGETSKVLLVALTCFFIVLINTIDSVSSVPKSYLDVGESCGTGHLATLRHIILPAALPQILTGMRLASGLAVIVIVGAEFVAADTGLGFLVWNSWNLGIPEYMYVGIISISILGVTASALVRGLERIAMPWRRGS
ncbi:ABC transporter permease [Microbacterium sp. A84]|uniref:ABC transporter permease n=1 Tax=Microbacterium sp. A84 TaxID=3450715 RepID=UPI003F436050